MQITSETTAILLESIEQASETFLITDIKGCIIYTNPSFEEVTGYTSAEAIGQNPRILNSGMTPPETYMELWQTIAAGGEWRGELNNRRKNGELFWEQVAISGIRDERGEMNHYVAVKEDITARKAIEDALRESEARLRGTLDALPDMMFEIGLDGRYYDYHAPRKELLATPPEAVLGRLLSDVLPADAAAVAMAAIREAHETGRSEGKQIQLLVPRGQLSFELSVSRKATGNGAEPRFIAISRDVTERRQAEETQLATAQRLEEAQRLARVGSWEWEIRSNTTVWSDNLYEIFGVTPGKFVPGDNAAFARLIHPADREATLQMLQNAITATEPVRFQYRIVRDDGVELTLGAMTLVDFDSERRAVRMRGTLQDITVQERLSLEHAQLEAQFRQAQKLEAVAQLAGGVAHDFNNMLGAILTAADMALLSIDKSSPVWEDLTEIQRTAHRSAALTRQLLTFARKETATPKYGDLNQLVRDMSEMLKRLVPESIDLDCKDISSLPCAIYMDHSHIDQILANLVVNARDAISGRGTIGVATTTADIDDTGNLAPGGVLPGRFGVICVDDDGCGMDADTLERIFEPFFTTKPVGQGTGLGMATVFGIAQQNGGFITVESALGVGTKIRVHLPIVEQPAGVTVRAPKTGEIPLGNETILFVEDDKTLLVLTTRLLRSLGYNVLPNGSPAEALELAAGYVGNIDLLVSDMVMPGMNGIELRDRMRAARPSLRYLFVSGYPAHTLVGYGLSVTDIDLLQKPMSRGSVAEKVRTVLDSPPRFPA